MKRLRPFNLAVVALWSACGLGALYYNFDLPDWLKVGILATSLYLFSIGAILQVLDGLRRRKGDTVGDVE